MARDHNCTPKTLAKSIKDSHLQDDLNAVYGGGDNPPVAPIVGEMEAPQGKERGLVETYQKSPYTDPEMAAKVSGTYDPITNKDTLAEAQSIISANKEAAYDRVLNNIEPGALTNAIGIDLFRQYQNAAKEALLKGDVANKDFFYNRANTVFDAMSEAATKSGQASQIFAIVEKLTPEGALFHTKKQIDKVNEGNKNYKQGKKLLGKAPDITKAVNEPLLGDLDTQINEVVEKVKSKNKVFQGLESSQQKLANRESSYIGSLGKKPKAKTPIQEMLNTLLEVAKEKLPGKEIKLKPKSPTEKLREILANKEQYKQVYEDAKKIVAEKYKGQPEVLAKIDTFLKTVIDKPFTEKNFQAFLREGLKQEDVNFRELVKKHYLDANKELGKLDQALIDKLGLNPQEAKIVAGDIQTELNKRINEVRKKELDKLLKDYPPKAKKALIEKIIEASNVGRFEPDRFRQLIAKKLGLTLLTEDTARVISSKASEVQAEVNLELRAEKAAELVKLMSNALPKSKLRQVATLQTMAQLLNPKTTIRNIVGNTLFAGAEKLVVDPIASGVDSIVSLITGKRSQVIPNYAEYGKGFAQGAKAGFRDAVKGIDTSGMGNKFELYQTEQFTAPILNNLEKAMNITLRTPDRAFYNATFKESLANQLKATKSTEPKPEMIQAAHVEALYTTFQDESYAARIFSGIKNTLNLKQDFGLGDFILKYPKTPGNLLARSFAYSPLGFVEAFGKMGFDVYSNKAFDQRAFVKSFARATTGTVGLGAMGYMLGKLGLATGEGETDKNINAVDKLEGAGKFKLNATGLMRFITGGLNPDLAKKQEGDIFFTYDWVQPFAIPFSAGVDIAASPKIETGSESLVNNFLGAGSSITNQPLFQGVSSLLSARDAEGKPNLLKGLGNVLSDSVSSFIPTASSQINQAIDNTQRETESNQLFGLQESLNKAMAKIPGLAQQLPERYDILGGKAEKYQDGSNNLFNVFLNPAFSSRIKNNPVINEVKRLFNRTSETQQAPRLVDKKINIIQGGKPVKLELTGEQISQYQQYVGDKTNRLVKYVIQQPSYKALNDSSKAEFLAGIISKVNTSAKVTLFRDERKLGKNPDPVIYGLLMGNSQYVIQGLQYDLYRKSRNDYKEASTRSSNRNYTQLLGN